MGGSLSHGSNLDKSDFDYCTVGLTKTSQLQLLGREMEIKAYQTLKTQVYVLTPVELGNNDR